MSTETMNGGNYEIEIVKRPAEVKSMPKLPFLCIHNQSGTYCGKGLVIRDTIGFTLVDLGTKESGGLFNTVSTNKSLEKLIEKWNIQPRDGKIIFFRSWGNN